MGKVLGNCQNQYAFNINTLILVNSNCKKPRLTKRAKLFCPRVMLCKQSGYLEARIMTPKAGRTLHSHTM